jgi:ATP-binding cassette subfamily B protein
MFDPQKGQIRVNGTNIKLLNLDSLRKMISYVPQDVFLFSDSIHHNINFSSGEDDIQKSKMAAENAVILDEVESLPDGFETMIGERGVTLSGGQKQRISIARALSKENDLLIFDDCLSAVDANTEHRIASNLNQYLADKTAIIITHRIFSSFVFDRIIVMEDGKIIENGTHEALIKADGYYANLLRTQQLDAGNAQQHSF